MNRSRVILLLWLVLLLATIGVVARARYITDLSAFLPRAPSATQQLLVNQLRDGLASRLVLIGIEGGDAAARATASRALAERLQTQGEFSWVRNGAAEAQQQDLQLLLAHRYALSPQVDAERFSVAGLRSAIQSSVDLLVSPAGALIEPFITRDPTGELVSLLDQVDAAAGPASTEGVWSSADASRAVLLAETSAAGSDLDGQQRALQRIEREWRALPATATSLRLQVSGAGSFAVAARDTIKSEALRLSLISSGLIMLLLWLAYRSLPAVLLGMVPVACGALAGIAAVALGFGAVHGVTLGFGVTLIGESVDYSIYQFVQSPQAAAHSRLWRTIGLGLVTSICGFASLLPSDFPGLAQLGVYSIAGLAVAAAVTRWVLPAMLPRHAMRLHRLAPLGQRIAPWLMRIRRVRAALIVLPLLGALVLFMHRERIWNRELAALSPTSLAAQTVDARLRADLGAPDLRHLVMVQGADAEAALRASERVAARLAPLVAAGNLGGFDTPARYLPSAATQRARLESIPPTAELRQRLQLAARDLPLNATRLEPFIAEAEAARRAPPLARADLTGTSLAPAVDGMLVQSGATWQALLPLRAAGDEQTIDVAAVRTALTGEADAVLIDIKQQSDALYADYLRQAALLSLTGLALLMVLLLATLRSARSVARVVLPMLLAVLVVAAGLVAAGVALSILHLVGMLLIVAVGSNYSLFFVRQQSGAEGPLTLASLLVANAATVIGFGVLATSSVPVLQALGVTVSAGALLALLFAAMLAPRAALASFAGEHP